MQQEVQIVVSPEVAATSWMLHDAVSRTTEIPANEITHIQILKRSFDARQRKIKVNLRLLVFQNEEFVEEKPWIPDYPDVSNAQSAVIAGAGPAGLFAALKLIEEGIKPIVLERGKTVRDRRRDLALINREHLINPDSNYCFGEGGAGTYSDGKLYTRSKKRGDVNRILKLLIAHGATSDILVEAHPHIGTNKLPGIVEAIREQIISHGGEIHFNTRLTDILIKSGSVVGVELQNGDRIDTSQLILATGHSARDIYELLARKKIHIEAKSFAIGVRVEHSQKLIDKIRYGCESRGEFLPPASYNMAKQIDGKGVYSFCMCPGGVIAPCATAQEEVVTNGWSPSKRDQRTSNSGIVVELKTEEFGSDDPLAGLRIQQKIEHKAWEMGGKTQAVPAQRLVDFTTGKLSADIPITSYIPGTRSAKLEELLPRDVYNRLTRGFVDFGRAMKGYMTNEAVVHAPESRTSSPVRIPRDRVSLQHPEIKGLYPCGEGAGYAGGIVSAAIDGEKCAEQCVLTTQRAAF